MTDIDIKKLQQERLIESVNRLANLNPQKIDKSVNGAARLNPQPAQQPSQSNPDDTRQSTQESKK